MPQLYLVLKGHTTMEISNVSDLLERARRMPFVEQLALCLSGSGSQATAFRIEEVSAEDVTGWIVVRCGGDTGFAVQVNSLLPSHSELRRRLNFVDVAKKLAAAFGGGAETVEITDDDDIPGDWMRWKVMLKQGGFFCASSPETPKLSFRGVYAAPSPKLVKVSLSLYGIVSEIDRRKTYRAGDLLRIFEINGTIDGLRRRVDIKVGMEGAMSVTVNNDGEFDTMTDSSFGVRIDVGEIKLSLEMMAALKGGATIELDAVLPMVCFLRVGSTTLAKGLLRTTEAGVSVEIEEVLV